MKDEKNYIFYFLSHIRYSEIAIVMTKSYRNAYTYCAFLNKTFYS